MRVESQLLQDFGEGPNISDDPAAAATGQQEAGADTVQVISNLVPGQSVEPAFLAADPIDGYSDGDSGGEWLGGDVEGFSSEDEDEDEDEDEEALHELQPEGGGVVVDGEHYDVDWDDDMGAQIVTFVPHLLVLHLYLERQKLCRYEVGEIGLVW